MENRRCMGKIDIKKYDYLIVGAGFAGSVMAERIANKLNKKVLIIDKRSHIGGNCHDTLDKTGILVQQYGPHIFHTNNKQVFNYLSQFTAWNNYKHKVVALYKGGYYSIPINLDTINKFYSLTLKNEKEVEDFLKTKKIKIKNIENSKDVVVSKFGEDLYEAFIKYYTKKQWGKFPEELDKSVLERLPIKYNNDPYYFNNIYQGMPLKGFTSIFEKMLSNKNITILLNKNFFKLPPNITYKHLIFTGRIDRFFNYQFGKLKYRHSDFTFEKINKSSYQPNSVINCTDKKTNFIRITEFKKFYNKKTTKTIICKENFRERGEATYPIINNNNLKLLKKYEKLSKNIKNTIFIGRLAQYKYLNIDQVIKKSLDTFALFPKTS